MNKTLIMVLVLSFNFFLSSAQSYIVEMRSEVDMATLVREEQEKEYGRKLTAEEQRAIDKATKRIGCDTQLFFTMHTSPADCSLKLDRKRSKMILKLGFIKLNLLKFMGKEEMNVFYDALTEKTYYEGKHKMHEEEDDVLGKQYKVEEGIYTTILGHQCVSAISQDREVRVWVATDIPYRAKAFRGCSGLVLGFDIVGELPVKATRITRTNRLPARPNKIFEN